MNLSPDEIIEKFADLTDKEIFILHCYAKRRLEGTSYSDPEDLIHEALYRALIGVRTCPADLPISVFIALTIKSIVAGDRRARWVSRRVWVDFDKYLASDDACEPSAEDSLVQDELTSLRREIINNAREALKDDRLATIVLDGLLLDLKRGELMEIHELSMHAFEAARKRIARMVRRKSNQ